MLKTFISVKGKAEIKNNLIWKVKMINQKIIRLFPLFGIVLLCSIMVSPLSLEAQRRGGGRGGGKGSRGGTEQRKEKTQNQAEVRFLKKCEILGLDEKQKQEVCKLFDNMQKERQRIENDQQSGALSTFAVEDRIKEIHREFNEKFEALLTEDQKQKLKELREDKKFQDE